MLLADDFGIDAFCVAIQLAKERAEQDSNNPFKEKVEDKKKFGKHRSDGGKKSFKNKSVGKNRSEGKSKGDGKMKENFSNLKTMMEFMKMMKNWKVETWKIETWKCETEKIENWQNKKK